MVRLNLLVSMLLANLQSFDVQKSTSVTRLEWVRHFPEAF